MRNLKAIEIAEGALLGDLAVIFELIVVYLPFVGDIFRFLIFVVFAVLVLRRGLYVGIMALFVSTFIATIVSGLHLFFPVQAVGGLFLGVAMRYRLRHAILLLLGVTAGALAFYSFTFLALLLAGLPVTTLIRSLHRIYDVLTALINIIAAKAGLQAWWKLNLYPAIAALAAWGFNYWWLSYYLVLWVVFWPIVTVIYVVTNGFVRLLGYDVRPFPDGKLNRLLRRSGRSLVKLGIRRGLIRRQRQS